MVEQLYFNICRYNIGTKCYPGVLDAAPTRPFPRPKKLLQSGVQTRYIREMGLLSIQRASKTTRLGCRVCLRV